MKKARNNLCNKILLLAVSCFFVCQSTQSFADISVQDKNKATTTDVDPHAHHKAMMKNKASFKLSTQKYNIPKLTLLDKMGIKTATDKIFNGEKTVVVNFIFTTCNTICPVMSGTFSQLDKHLAKTGKDVELISISIDPEFDTPKVLQNYGKKFNSSDQWSFYTGSRDDIITLQTAFNAYRGSKMNHVPITLLRSASSEEWTRIDGFASSKQLMSEIDIKE